MRAGLITMSAFAILGKRGGNIVSSLPTCAVSSFHPSLAHLRSRSCSRIFSTAAQSSINEQDLERMEVSTTSDATTPLSASQLGLDPALNRFHAPIVHHEEYSFDDWPPNHTFPMDKFQKTAEALLTTSAKTHPAASRLPRPLVRRPEDFFRPLDRDEIPMDDWFAQPKGPICAKFLNDFLQGRLTNEQARYIGFREQVYRPELIRRTVLEVAGTLLTAQLAVRYGIASNVAGGTHHATPTHGAGYTILNDLAVTAKYVTSPERTHNNIQRVLVIDADVHQGDGTAQFGDFGNHRLSTLSIHCASNYPRLKANSTYDVGLRDGCGDDEYMDILQSSVNRALQEVQPDLVLYDAGVDVYIHDKLGRLDLSEEGIRRRDRWVLERCVTAGIPVAAVVGGGYDKDVEALGRRHAIVHEECAFVWRKYNLWKRAPAF